MGTLLASLLLGSTLLGAGDWCSDPGFDEVSAEDPGAWEVRYGAKTSEPDSRPRWEVVPRGSAGDGHLSLEATGRAAGTAYIGQRVTLPEAPLPTAELGITYQTHCALKNRSGGLSVGLFSPQTWDALARESSAAGPLAPDLFALEVHPNGEDASRWTEARVASPELQRVLEQHAGEQVVVALVWSTWHPASEEWAKFDELRLGPARPFLRARSWPRWFFRGEALLLRVEAARAERVELHWSSASTPVETLAMTPVGEGLHEASLPVGGSSQDLEVWAEMTTDEGHRLALEPLVLRPTARPTHPGVLYDEGDVERMRAKIERLDWARATFETFERNADAWLAREDRPPTTSGGWSHDYVCPDDGRRLSFREESPTRHRCKSCGEEWSGPKLDAAWTGVMHGRWAAGARDMALVYQLTGDGRYGRGAARVLLFYARHYAAFPLGKGPAGRGKVMAQSLSEASWLLRMLEAADLAFPELTREEQRTVERDLIRAAAEHIWPYKFGIHNIQCWQNAAMSVSGYFLGDPEMIARGREGQTGFEQQVARGILPDGMWFERSLGYHDYTLRALIYHCEAARRAGDDLHELGRVREMFTLPLRLSQPNLVPPSLNDQGYRTRPIGTRELVIAHAWYNDPESAAALRLLHERGAKRGGLSDLMYLDELPEGQAYALPGSEDLAGSGLVVLRRGRGQDALCAMLEYGEHGGGHGHPDKLQLILYGLGQTLCPDLGTTGYGVPLHRGWYKTTPSHNTLVIGHANQKPTTGELLAFHAGEAYSAATAESRGAYPGYRLTRRLLLTDGVLVDLFEVVGDEPRDLDWFLRAPGVLTVDLALRPREEQPPNATYAYLSDLRGATSDEAWSAHWSVANAGTLHLSFDAAQGTEVLDALAPSMAGEPRWRTLRVRRNASTTSFRVVHQLLSPGTEPEEVRFDNDAIHVGRRTIRLPREDDAVLELSP